MVKKFNHFVTVNAFYLLSGLYPQIILRDNFNFLKSKFLVSLSGMVETPRLQAKHDRRSGRKYTSQYFKGVPNLFTGFEYLSASSRQLLKPPAFSRWSFTCFVGLFTFIECSYAAIIEAYKRFATQYR